MRYTPDKARIAYLPAFSYYSGNCNEEEAQDEIKRNFIALLSSDFVPASICKTNSAECSVENVNVFCGATSSAKRRRRRRSSVREVYIKVDIVAQEKSAAAPQTLSQLEQTLNNDAYPQLDQKARSFDWSPLRASADLEYERYTITSAEAYCSDAGAVVGKCSSLETGCDGLSKPHSMCQCNSDSGAIEKCSKYWPFSSSLYLNAIKET